jgi:hypothetical protein
MILRSALFLMLLTSHGQAADRLLTGTERHNTFVALDLETRHSPLTCSDGTSTWSPWWIPFDDYRSGGADLFEDEAKLGYRIINQTKIRFRQERTEHRITLDKLREKIIRIESLYEVLVRQNHGDEHNPAWKDVWVERRNPSTCE